MMQIRLATSDDALSLGALGTQVFLDTYAVLGIRPSLAEEVRRSFSMSAMQTALAQPGVVICVAEFNAHLVGFAQISLNTSQALVQAAQPAELGRLYVQRPFLGQRVGGQLLHEAEELAAQHGADALWCSVWTHNVRALRFYERQGYADLGGSVFVMDRERHDNRVVCKTL
ncbi:MAG TPA: GNAT family N-acetyltransferase [Burkholderiaceae bacterium]|jgi:ribosomal protein S18 acetylase RimI-like enzyme